MPEYLKEEPGPRFHWGSIVMSPGETLGHFLEQFKRWENNESGFLDSIVHWDALGGLFDRLSPDVDGSTSARLPILGKRVGETVITEKGLVFVSE